METEVKKPEPPAGTSFTLILPLDKKIDGKKATYYMKDMDEPTFFMIRSLIDAKKHHEAVRVWIKALSIVGDGADSLDFLRTNFIAVNAALPHMLDEISPLDSELKKN